jgi:DSF synthase
MFPGMGAFSFLSRRLDGTRARELILSGKLYGAEELAELGVVDLVVPAGEGEDGLRAYIDRHAQRHNVLAALARVGRRCHPVSYDELLDIADIWVATALGLSETDLRRMERLASAQQRRQARASA